MASTLNEMLYEQRNETGDVTFTVDSQKIYAHRCILAASSAVFEETFFGSDPHEGNITVSDASADAFNEFIKCFYGLPIILREENIEQILKLIMKLDLKCIAECEFDLKNCALCWTFEAAMKYDIPSLQKFCEREIAANASEVLQSDSFIRCGYKVLLSIMNNRSLKCKEIDVLRACISWAKETCRRKQLDDADSAYDVRDLREAVGDAVIFIRFASMNIHEFCDFNKEYDGFFGPAEFIEISSIIFQSHLNGFKPKKFNLEPR